MKRPSAILAASLLAGMSCISSAAAQSTQTANAQARADQLAAELVDKLSLDEKVDQLLNTATITIMRRTARQPWRRHCAPASTANAMGRRSPTPPASASAIARRCPAA